MPHVSFVLFSGLRIHEETLREVGMALPGLSDRAAAISELPGLGLLTLAGMLPNRWSCTYHNRTADIEALFDSVRGDRPDLVAVSALTASVEDAYRFNAMLMADGIPVVMGGLHVTACSNEAARHCTSIVVGEGEAVWNQVLSDAEDGTLEPIYSSFTQKSETSWPLPRFDLLGESPPRFTLQTQRGCPLACEFCGASRLLSGYREKPIQNVQQELEAIGSIDPTPVIELADDNTFVERQQLDKFLDAFSAAGVRYFTEADWRIGLNTELLRNLAKSGCVQVLMGIESLVFRYPGMGRKATELDSVIEAVEALQESGVAVNGCFIIGADGETEESIDSLVQFILDSPFADVQLTLQTPFAGTRLYDRLKQSQRLIDERGWSHYTLFDVTYVPDKMTVKELEIAFRRALAEVYSPAATARRRTIRKRIWKRNPQLSPAGHL